MYLQEGRRNLFHLSNYLTRVHIARFLATRDLFEHVHLLDSSPHHPHHPHHRGQLDIFLRLILRFRRNQ